MPQNNHWWLILHTVFQDGAQSFCWMEETRLYLKRHHTGKITFLGKLYKYKIFTIKKTNHNIGPLLFANIQHWCSEHCRANRKESRWAVLACPSFLISFVVGWFSDKSRIGQWLACHAVILCCSQWRGQWCIYNEATKKKKKVRLTQWGLTGGVLNWWFESQTFSPNAIWGLCQQFYRRLCYNGVICVECRLTRRDKGHPLSRYTISKAMIDPSSSSLTL